MTVDVEFFVVMLVTFVSVVHRVSAYDISNCSSAGRNSILHTVHCISLYCTLFFPDINTGYIF